MGKESWKASDDLLRLFQSVGRASLLSDIQDSHSGNMAVRWRNELGEEKIVITATGSQKGDLEPDQICFLSPTGTDFGYYKASSETDIHARILSLEGVGASIHAHTKDLMVMTLDDRDKPNQPAPFIPIDPLGHYRLGGLVPVDWVEIPSGSSDMARIIAGRLLQHPAAVIQTHGTFARGRTLKEAFSTVAIANHSGSIVRLCLKLGIDVETIRKKIRDDPDAHFQHPLLDYTVEGDDICDFPEEEEILREFTKTGARIFESRLSPFHTGSLSVRGVSSLLYAPKASMPREMGGPLLEVPLAVEEFDPPELRLHKEIYAESDFQTVLHCYVPEAEAHSHFIYPGEKEACDRIVPIDAEGSFLYLVIPVVPPKTDTGTLIKLLHDYKVVVVRGGGVWGVGAQSLSEVLHHPSSVREICLYRIGAFERGLNLRKLEPKKALRW
jgi:L-fuculose-phosphate aldolase